MRATPIRLRLLLALTAAICTMPAWAVTPASSPEAERSPPPLNLRLPQSTMRDAGPMVQIPPSKPAAIAGHSMRLQPVRNVFEWGVEGSREALIACQKGAYPGAAVAAYQTWTQKSNAQPDHCDRF